MLWTGIVLLFVILLVVALLGIRDGLVGARVPHIDPPPLPPTPRPRKTQLSAEDWAIIKRNPEQHLLDLLHNVSFSDAEECPMCENSYESFTFHLRRRLEQRIVAKAEQEKDCHG